MGPVQDNESNLSETKEEMEQISTKLLELLQAFKGVPLSKVPAIAPFAKWLNGRLIDIQRGSIEVEYDIRPEMANPAHLLHGGVQCSMIDDAMGMICATLGHKGFLVSIDMHINFLGKVKVGEKVNAKGKVIREGRRIVNIDVNLINEKGKIVSNGSSNFVITNVIPDFLKRLKL